MRKTFVGVKLDAEGLRLLRAIAQQTNEGNVSRTVRDLVREAARARGLLHSNEERTATVSNSRER